MDVPNVTAHSDLNAHPAPLGISMGQGAASRLPGPILIPLGHPFSRSGLFSWPFSLLLFGKSQSSSSSDLIAL